MNVIIHWVILSIALHAVVLLYFSGFLPSTVTTVQSGQLTSIEAILQQKQGLLPVESIEKANEAKPKHSATKVLVSEAKDVVKENSNLLPTVIEPVSTTPIVLTAAVAAEGGAQVAESRIRPQGNISQDELRDYRLNLSREARRYKRYPAFARQQGMEGVAVIVVIGRAGGAVPQVSLNRSSGHEVLDRQAIDMLGLAVRAASVPGTLSGHDFSLEMPVHFSLED